MLVLNKSSCHEGTDFWRQNRSYFQSSQEIILYFLSMMLTDDDWVNEEKKIKVKEILVKSIMVDNVSLNKSSK